MITWNWKKFYHFALSLASPLKNLSIDWFFFFFNFADMLSSFNIKYNFEMYLYDIIVVRRKPNISGQQPHLYKKEILAKKNQIAFY